MAALSSAQRSANRTVLRRLCLVALAMFGFGYLLVPLYDKFCEVTGIRNLGKADVVTNTQIDATRSLRVELDGSVRGLPWQFKPRISQVDVHPGELKQVVFDVVNTTDRSIVGQAIPSFAPLHAAQYFRKLDCFCFTTQTLRPNERREMPVVFVVAPDVPGELTTITLSYTFFEVEGAAKVAASRTATEE